LALGFTNSVIAIGLSTTQSSRNRIISWDVPCGAFQRLEHEPKPHDARQSARAQHEPRAPRLQRIKHQHCDHRRQTESRERVYLAALLSFYEPSLVQAMAFFAVAAVNQPVRRDEP